MKNILIGTFLFFVIVGTMMVQCQLFLCNSLYPNIFDCGERQDGDQLLFDDINTSNWTVGIDNLLHVEYDNINITWFRVELSNNWWLFRATVNYTFPSLRVTSFARNSTLPFEINVTGYGFPHNNTAVPYGCVLQQDETDEKNTVTYHNPKYHLD